MDNDEVIEIINKMKYQISVLGETIDYNKHPIEALVLSMDWGSEQIDRVHDIFERWDERLSQGGKITHGEFEKDFNDSLGISYQALKSIVNAFYKNGQWTNVCVAYVDSFGDSAPIEYHRILRQE